MPLTIEILLSILVPFLTLALVLIGLGHRTAIRRISKLEERFEQKTDDIERNLRHRISDANSNLVAAVSRMDHKRTDDLDRLFSSLDEVRQITRQGHHFTRRSGGKKTKGRRAEDKEPMTISPKVQDKTEQ